MDWSPDENLNPEQGVLLNPKPSASKQSDREDVVPGTDGAEKTTPYTALESFFNEPTGPVEKRKNVLDETKLENREDPALFSTWPPDSSERKNAAEFSIVPPLDCSEEKEETQFSHVNPISCCEPEIDDTSNKRKCDEDPEKNSSSSGNGSEGISERSFENDADAEQPQKGSHSSLSTTILSKPSPPIINGNMGDFGIMEVKRPRSNESDSSLYSTVEGANSNIIRTGSDKALYELLSQDTSKKITERLTSLSQSSFKNLELFHHQFVGELPLSSETSSVFDDKGKSQVGGDAVVEDSKEKEEANVIVDSGAGKNEKLYGDEEMLGEGSLSNETQSEEIKLIVSSYLDSIEQDWRMKRDSLQLENENNKEVDESAEEDFFVCPYITFQECIMDKEIEFQIPCDLPEIIKTANKEKETPNEKVDNKQRSSAGKRQPIPSRIPIVVKKHVKPETDATSKNKIVIMVEPMQTKQGKIVPNQAKVTPKQVKSGKVEQKQGKQVVKPELKKPTVNSKKSVNLKAGNKKSGTDEKKTTTKKEEPKVEPAVQPEEQAPAKEEENKEPSPPERIEKMMSNIFIAASKTSLKQLTSLEETPGGNVSLLTPEGNKGVQSSAEKIVSSFVKKYINSLEKEWARRRSMWLEGNNSNQNNQQRSPYFHETFVKCLVNNQIKLQVPFDLPEFFTN